MADETKPRKPGYKTSEFAVTLATTLGGLAMASGLLHPSDATNVKAATEAISAASGQAAGQGWMGLAIALVSQAMYVWSRTRAKQ